MPPIDVCEPALPRIILEKVLFAKGARSRRHGFPIDCLYKCFFFFFHTCTRTYTSEEYVRTNKLHFYVIEVTAAHFHRLLHNLLFLFYILYHIFISINFYHFQSLFFRYYNRGKTFGTKLQISLPFAFKVTSVFFCFVCTICLFVDACLESQTKIKSPHSIFREKTQNKPTTTKATKTTNTKRKLSEV